MKEQGRALLAGGNDDEREEGGTPSPIGRQVGLIVSLAVLGIVCINSSHWLGLIIRQSWVVIIPGWALVVAGVAVRVLAAIELGSTRQIDALVTSGIYGRTRNPIYLALVLVVVGVALVSGAILAVGWVMASGVALYWLAKCEERDLETVFGEAYLRYRQDVPMFWPRLGR
jgi:protein-S-isoprenylcysteine O-methyltransferase Ste14